MNTLLRAIITGFGFKLGSDLYKYVGKKLKLPFVSRDDEDNDGDEK
ncbi:MAG: hypothetical protein H6713_29160 [Myxococcales bacterium]|nr:hypothetical protein [Myxococcales bacterium]MCB9754033.1 hypothetical protein [Myxococcales bacterium]